MVLRSDDSVNEKSHWSGFVGVKERKRSSSAYQPNAFSIRVKGVQVEFLPSSIGSAVAAVDGGAKAVKQSSTTENSSLIKQTLCAKIEHNPAE
jgi:hypothetical protein